MAKIYYARTDEFWRKGEKYAFLEETQHVGGVEWRELQPDAKHNWLTEGMREEFETLTPMGNKETKALKERAEVIFRTFSNGIKSNNDAYVYDFDEKALVQRAQEMAEDYNAEVDHWKRKGAPKNIEGFIKVDEKRLKWIRNTKRSLLRGKEAEFDEAKIKKALYRPFCKQHYYYDSIFSEDVYQWPKIIPAGDSVDNLLICVSDKGFRSPFSVLMADSIVDLHLCASTDLFQCFPFYTYDEDGTNRRENVTDWALEKFREQYSDRALTKWDIFHYVYAVLHHPAYRERYAANLKRVLPRIPFAPDFRAFVRAGERLAELHVGYERQPEYTLERVEAAGVAVSWRVEKMRLSRDRQSVVYNEFLTLAGVPPEAFEYRLGNRSALEWVIDQYQLTTDRRSGITNDPNRADDPHYILRLVGQVITVSLETAALVRNLPPLGLENAEAT